MTPLGENMGPRGESPLEDSRKDLDVLPGDDGGTTVIFVVVRISGRRKVCLGAEAIFDQEGLGMVETHIGEGPTTEEGGNALTAGTSANPGQAPTMGSGGSFKGWVTGGGER